MQQRIVGTDKPMEKGYIHTFSTLPLKNYRVVTIGNRIERYAHIAHRLRLPDTYLDSTRMFLADKSPRSNLIHLWNKINLGSQPWVMSLEYPVFHYDFRYRACKRIAVQKLASTQCRSVLPFSQSAYRELDKVLSDFYPGSRDAIIGKMQVSSPVQDPLVSRYEDKGIDCSPIVFTLVGDEFFRKGGEEVLKAFDELLQQGCPIRLNIISGFTQQYAPFSEPNVDISDCHRILDKYPQQITVMKGLPHQKVLDVIKRSHVGLLPSYAETYGYSILEAQAAACPAITTNVRAFPEINNEDVGWIINVQKDEKEDALMWPRQEKERTSLILRRELVRIIGEIVDSPSLIREKGIRALARIREDHAPYKRAATMAAIYDSALGIAQTSIHSLGSPTP